jgi:adenosyl cobinamide kinase/adenosyl cobinamide phosphate guanylyltransferase
MRGAGSAGPQNKGLTLLLGGARAGKSVAASTMASRWDGPVVVIATAEARDDEMAERIRRHRAHRPPEWTTVEEPVDLEAALSDLPPNACALVDCLTLWVSNLMESGLTDDDIDEKSAKAAAIAAARTSPTIVVSNEVGWGIVPADPQTRRYRDALGRVNAAWADASARALLVVAGKTLPLEGMP